MTQKISLILPALALGSAFTFAELGCARRPSPRSGTESVTVESNGFTEKSGQEIDGQIQTLISSLSSNDDKVRRDAERDLIGLRDSPAKRKIVIEKLLDSIRNNQQLDGNHPILTSTLEFWRSATHVLAGLRAEEAINPMIKCIHCSNGLSGIEGEPPASYALTSQFLN